MVNLQNTFSVLGGAQHSKFCDFFKKKKTGNIYFSDLGETMLVGNVI
jgi:hypothetical protein